MGALLTPEVLSIVGSVLGSALLFLFRQIFKDKAAARELLLKTGIEVAFNVVNDLAKRTPNQVDDKVALGLKALAEYLAAHGEVLTPTDTAKAQLVFSAMNGAGK